MTLIRIDKAFQKYSLYMCTNHQRVVNRTRYIQVTIYYICLFSPIHTFDCVVEPCPYQGFLLCAHLFHLWHLLNSLYIHITKSVCLLCLEHCEVRLCCFYAYFLLAHSLLSKLYCYNANAKKTKYILF